VSAVRRTATSLALTRRAADSIVQGGRTHRPMQCRQRAAPTTEADHLITCGDFRYCRDSHRTAAFLCAALCSLDSLAPSCWNLLLPGSESARLSLAQADAFRSSTLTARPSAVAHLSGVTPFPSSAPSLSLSLSLFPAAFCDCGRRASSLWPGCGDFDLLVDSSARKKGEGEHYRKGGSRKRNKC
jgi:hypothetical protein